MDILIPGSSGLVQAIDPSSGAMIEAGVKTLPDGFRMVASVERPNGDMEDLGQNADGKFALFRRRTDPYDFYSHGPAQRLSDADVAGFGILRAVCFEPADMEDWGEFSSLCKSNLLPIN